MNDHGHRMQWVDRMVMLTGMSREDADHEYWLWYDLQTGNEEEEEEDAR